MCHKMFGCLPFVHSRRIAYTVDFKNMPPEEKKVRVKYLWFKVRSIYNMLKFINYLR